MPVNVIVSPSPSTWPDRRRGSRQGRENRNNAVRMVSSFLADTNGAAPPGTAGHPADLADRASRSSISGSDMQAMTRSELWSANGIAAASAGSTGIAGPAEAAGRRPGARCHWRSAGLWW